MSWFLWPRPMGHFQRKGLRARRVESREAGLAGWPLLGGFGVTLCWCLCRCSNLQAQQSAYWESISLSQGLFLLTQVMEIHIEPDAWACLQADLACGKLDFPSKLVWGAWLLTRPVTERGSVLPSPASLSRSSAVQPNSESWAGPFAPSHLQITMGKITFLYLTLDTLQGVLLPAWRDIAGI